MSIEEAIDILRGIKDGTACLMKDMPKRGEIAIDMAIDALKQSEPCEDAVSRKAVIEITAETGALETQCRVKQLPPVTPKYRTGKWISCSERLPDVDEEVLVTNYAGGIYNIEIDSCGKYLDNDGRFWYTAQNPIAWMPLPKTWEGDTE